MKKSFFPLLLSVIAGVAIGLTITLRLWGPEWYKVIVAVFAGILGGLISYDPKEFMSMAKQAFRQSLGIISRFPYVGKKVRRISTQKIPAAKTFLARRFLRFSLFIAILLVYAVIINVFVAGLYYSGALPYLFPPHYESWPPILCTLCIAIFFGSMMSIFVCSSGVSDWRKALSSERTERIWKGKWNWQDESYISDHFISRYFWSNIYEHCSYREIFIGVVKTVATMCFRALWRLAKIVFGLIIFLPTWAFILVLDFVMLLGMLVHIAAAIQSRLLIMISIALGVVAGTVFSSSLLGFTIGGGSAIIGYLVGEYFPDDMPGLLTRFNKIKPVYSIRKRLFVGPFSA